MEGNHHKNTISSNLPPVEAETSGDGLPYAPENWPEPGDTWGWRTGRRVVPNGYFQDRYLYLPIRLRAKNRGSSRKQRHTFPSKVSVERYIKDLSPDADVDAFFASFSWKIPAIHSASTNGNVVPIPAVPLQQIANAEEEDSDTDLGTDIVKCKGGNKMCDSLVLEEVERYSPALPCDICCSVSDFCRDCCCILCCKTVSSAYGRYSYIKCHVDTGEGKCGHVAHMECALRSRMAGTVGGSIGLDAEYLCRRCDGRTDLISHVNELLQTCKAIDLDDEIQKKILNLGSCLLRGSLKPQARELLSHIELANSKLCGTNLQDIWKVDDNLVAHSAGLSDHGNDEMEVPINASSLDVRLGEEPSDYLSHSLKLQDEIDQVLQALRKSQEYEYKLAEERLQEHKTYLQNLYQQLDSEKSKLECQNSSLSDDLFHAVRERKEQIRQEMRKFNVMKKVANGFGKTSKDILKEQFGLKMAD